MSNASQRSYAAAIDALNSLQSNAATLEAIRRSGRTVNELNEHEMTEYLSRINHHRSELDDINVIHITGTKGKGSTASFCDTLLRHVQPPTGKVGLYTSPHMVAARERIRIDGAPISEEEFAKYFWEVWERLEANPHRQFDTTPLRPMYFRFLTLLAMHVFISLKVSAAIFEVGIGGLYDSTNIVQRPVVTGVTALGLDHTALLGHTIEEIALQKAGIFKKGAPALSVEQPESAIEVMSSYAKQVGSSSFKVVPVWHSLSSVRLGLPGAHQQANASLAIELVRAFARSAAGDKVMPGASAQLGGEGEPPNAAVLQALEKAFWPGRCQVVPAVPTANATYYLDGAHTVESVPLCVKWFVQDTATQTHPKFLVFNCTNGRSAKSLLGAMLEELLAQGQDPHTYFQRVYFCTNNTFADGHSASDLTSHAMDPKDLESMTVQRDLLQAWCELLELPSPADDALQATWRGHHYAKVMPSIEHVMQDIKACVPATPDVFVAGSLHLVGGFMAHLQKQGMLDACLKSTQASE